MGPARAERECPRSPPATCGCGRRDREFCPTARDHRTDCSCGWFKSSSRSRGRQASQPSALSAVRSFLGNFRIVRQGRSSRLHVASNVASGFRPRRREVPRRLTRPLVICQPGHSHQQGHSNRLFVHNSLAQVVIAHLVPVLARPMVLSEIPASSSARNSPTALSR